MNSREPLFDPGSTYGHALRSRAPAFPLQILPFSLFCGFAFCGHAFAAGRILTALLCAHLRFQSSTLQ